MAFVFSPWYIVMIILVAAIVASILIFVKMDKKDKELIAKFIEDSTKEETPAAPVAPVAEQHTEVKAE